MSLVQLWPVRTQKRFPPPIKIAACKRADYGGHSSYLTTVTFPWISHTWSAWLPVLAILQHKIDGGKMRKTMGGLFWKWQRWRDPESEMPQPETKPISRSEIVHAKEWKITLMIGDEKSFLKKCEGIPKYPTQKRVDTWKKATRWMKGRQTSQCNQPWVRVAEEEVTPR